MKLSAWLLCFVSLFCLTGAGEHPLAAPNVTSLTNPKVKYSVPKEGSVTLTAGDVTMVIVDNSASQTELTPEHKAGYNGVAYLGHAKRKSNLFVPTYAGLNYEHIYDGTLKVKQEIFEPRRFPIQLRIINESTVELYQAPTPNWKLESCSRYQLLADGTIEYTFECIPREKLFKQGYIGLFWASYIHRPEKIGINFLGKEENDQEPKWIHAVSPEHGVNSTHPPANYPYSIAFEDGFPITLANHPSGYVYSAPAYYGVSHGMAFVQMFRKKDHIWFAQSPTGGGKTNPAWDFHWFIPNYKVNEAYGFVMRAAYFPYENQNQVVDRATLHLKNLNDE